MRRRLSERGQASVELLLMLPAILLLGLVVWQVHLTLTVADDAENAARTASRSGGGAAAARNALEPQYRDNITPCKPGVTECGIQVSGRAVKIWVDVPIIVPGGSNLGLGLKVHGEAAMPEGLDMGLKDRTLGETPGAGEPSEDGDVALPERGIGYFKRKLLEEVDLAELVKLGPSQRRARLESLVAELLSREGPVLSSNARSRLIRQIVDESLGLGILEPLLADETITEIMVNGPSEVWVERHGNLHRIDARFTSEAELMQTIDRIVSTVNRRVDESSPMVDARLPSGERVNVIIPPLSLVGPVLSIRRFPRAFTFEQLVRMGTVDPDTADLLRSLVRARMSIVVSGGTSSGKTTLLNALSGFIPAEERIVTIEDSAELQLQQPHVISLEARPANVEGKGHVSIRDLVRNSLRMRPDRIVVGEVRGPETIDMLQAMNTGHDGSLTTVHANSTEDSVVRMQTLASMSEVDVPFAALRDQINSAIDVIVQLERGADGRRRIVEVAAVSSRLREEFRLATIMRFDPDPIGSDRVVTGTWVHYPLPDVVAERLRVRAEVAPAVYTEEAADELEAPERELDQPEAHHLSSTAGPDAPRG